MDKNNFLTLDNLSFGYPNSHNDTLCNINEGFALGSITLVTGGNGTGKTTLGKLMCGILRPTSGRVLLQGSDIVAMRLPQVAQQVCYCFQNPSCQLFTSSVRQELAFALAYRGIDSATIAAVVEEQLECFDLVAVADSHPQLLSFGERQRLAIAAGLLLQPKFVILDEPTAGLDATRRDALCLLLRELRDYGTGIAVISHDTSLVDSLADRVLVVREGGLHAD